MKKTSEPITYLLICFSLLILVSLACNMPRGGGGNLLLDPRAEDGSVSGSYRAPEGSGEKINFTVDADGFATFRLEAAPESETLYVDLEDELTVNLAWNGANLDGMGALTSEEQAALNDLMESDLAHSLEMIPLDIACQGEENIDAKQVAALLIPLQMHYKYAVTERWAESQELIALSQCEYGNGEESEGENTSLIMLSPSTPIPVVFGYFPFDEEGAVEPANSSERGLETACLATSSTWIADGPIFNWLGRNLGTIPGVRTNEWGPCGAKCRGACGADCEPNNCKMRKEQRCEKNWEGKNTGMVTQYLIYDCGMHQGCIDHDNCYDYCNETYGCNTWRAGICRHDWSPLGEVVSVETFNWYCDQRAISEHGAVNPPLWAKGFGPQPMRETFEYLDESYERRLNPEECPVEDEDFEYPPEGEGEQIPVGTYVGTTDYPQYIAKIFNPGQFSTNEVIIHVAEDGTVTGSFSIYYIGDTFVREDNGCVKHWEAEISGSFSGQLLGNHGTITSTENWSCTLYADCSDTGECDEGSITRQIEVRISGNQMTGTTLPHPEDADGLWIWTFNATKE
jgi:hypothetical protein